MATHMEEAEKQILAALLRDFSERNLNSNHLSNGYKGPQVSDLSAAICTDDEVSQVDFDVALSDLEKKKLISTGPYKTIENKPGSGVIFLGAYSTREYAGLTQLGYKAARQPPNRPSRIQRLVNNVHISGGQFSNLQLAAGNTITQSIEPTPDADSEILMKLITALEKQGQAVSIEQRHDLVDAIKNAKEGNGKEAKGLLEKVCGPAWRAVQPVIWPILGDLVRKSLGL